MNLGRVAIACVAPIALSLTALSAPALAQTRSAFENAVLNELDPAVRADVERRATAGNTVMGVIGTTLLNNYYKAGARNPGRAVSVVAVDFSRGTVVFQRAPNVFEIRRFDPKTLRFLR